MTDADAITIRARLRELEARVGALERTHRDMATEIGALKVQVAREQRAAPVPQGPGY